MVFVVFKPNSTKSPLLTSANCLQDGKKLTFKVKWQAPLQKVFNAFCQRMSLNQDEVVFLHNSERLRKEQTLGEVGLQLLAANCQEEDIMT